MERLILNLVVSVLLTSCSTTYYIVRHAERAQVATPGSPSMATTNDPPLSKEGEVRAVALKDELKHKGIRYIFSTNTIRTTATAAPIAASTGVNTKFYTQVDRDFINKLKSINQNTLVVGYSNTVDDIIHQLTGTNHLPADLPEIAYDNLFIVKKKGNKMSFKASTYGAPAH